MATYREVVAQRVREHHKAAENLAAGIEPDNFIPTGIKAWDDSGGLEAGMLTIIAAPTGEGKSAVLLTLATAAAKAGIPVLILSFEDPEGKTADRTLSTLTGVNSQVLGRMRYKPEVLNQLDAAEAEVGAWADLIDFRAGLKTSREALQVVAGSDAGLILVDYAQALPDDERTRERMLSDTGWDLNKMAQDKHAAVVLFSQTRPEVEERGQQRFMRDGSVEGYRPGPGKSDLAWAKSLGEKCKCLIYLFRPGRWAKACGLDNKDETMELIFVKVNFGTEGTIRVGWHGPSASIRDAKKA